MSAPLKPGDTVEVSIFKTAPDRWTACVNRVGEIVSILTGPPCLTFEACVNWVVSIQGALRACDVTVRPYQLRKPCAASGRHPAMAVALELADRAEATP